jgi:hypothetical protein
MLRRVRYQEPSRALEILLVFLVAVVLGFAALVLSGALTPAHGGTCPADTLLGDEYFTPSATSTKSYGGGIVREDGAYDLVAGTVAARTRSVLDASITLVIARDEYVLDGLPAGTPISFDVVIDATSTLAAGSGSSSFSISREGAGIAGGGGGNWAGSVVLHLQELAGVPFVLRYSVGQFIGKIGTLTDVSGSGSFHFANLPPNTHIASCQGYVQDAVPAIASSWGSLKAAYH